MSDDERDVAALVPFARVVAGIDADTVTIETEGPGDDPFAWSGLSCGVRIHHSGGAVTIVRGTTWREALREAIGESGDAPNVESRIVPLAMMAAGWGGDGNTITVGQATHGGILVRRVGIESMILLPSQWRAALSAVLGGVR